ncbi:uncharacterized protein Dwil_GK10896 [Drosophila willistoni]|uniref:Peptidase S1 domain-containing protein n=1 Tax=Drosophila willistoni TaxID=7260 RepID=B4N9J2_DROWI|nr:uncharacterized protein Dwil_GK10896 [Drosophila willistoni]
MPMAARPTAIPSSQKMGIALAQHLPPNNCGNIFHYERFNDRWIGRVTPPQDGLKSLDWLIRFVAHGSNIAGTVSNLHPYPNKEKAYENMFAGGRGESYVTFDNFHDELPKIVRVELNGQVYCTASEYGAPSTTMTRKQHISVSTTTQNVGHHPVVYQKPKPAPTPPPTPPPTRTPIRLPNFSNSGGGGGGSSSNNNGWQGNPFLQGFFKPETIHVDSPSNSLDECGVEGFAALQAGGEILPRGRFPWLAALYSGTTDLVYRCVTTLVSKRTVITAAHCIYSMDPDRLRVYLGRHDRNMNPEKGATLMRVQSVRTHPDFIGNVVPDSDVGLLVLTETVIYSNYIRPICLWTSTTHLGMNDNDVAAVAGWGLDENGKETQFPKTVRVRTVSREECLREMVTAKDFLTPRTICAGNSQEHGPCLGDSGGGLMVLRNERWMVRGIVSLAQRRGDNCDLSRFVIYCDVARHLNWIEQNIVR